MKPSIICTLAVLAAASPEARANQIVNGGFESPDTSSFITVNVGDPAIAPWVITRTSVDVVEINNGGVFGPAYEGTQYLDLDGSPGPGELHQSFATTPGTLYSLFFAYANHYQIQSVASAIVRVHDSGGDLLNTTISHSTSQGGDYDWTTFNSQFVANSNSTTLEFSSFGGPPDNGGIFLDAISIEAIPEPATTAFVGTAALMLVIRRRRCPGR